MTALIISIATGVFISLLIVIMRQYAKIRMLEKDAEERQNNESIREEQLEIAANYISHNPRERMRDGKL